MDFSIQSHYRTYCLAPEILQQNQAIITVLQVIKGDHR